MAGTAFLGLGGAMSPEAAAKNIKRMSKRIAFMIGATSLFTIGITTGMLADGVSESMISWRMKQQQPPESSIPKHIRRAQIVRDAYPENGYPQASLTQASYPSAVPVQQAAYFPDNNRVDWKVSMRPGDVPSSFAVHNSATRYNRMLLFYIATGQPAQPWMPAATLYMQAGKTSQLRLPRGRYLIQTITTPVEMPYEQAVRSPAVNLTQVDLTQPSTTRMIIQPNNMVRTQSPTSSYAGSYRQPRNAIEEVEQMASRHQGRSVGSVYDRLTPSNPDRTEPEEYAGLIQAAMTN